jgi:hypothetical protein
VGLYNVLALYRRGTLPEGTQEAGRPVIRWLDSVEEDLRTTVIRNWTQKSQDEEQWQAIIKEVKVHYGL